MANEEKSLLKKIGVGLMGFGQGMTGQPYLTNYNSIQAAAQQDKMQRDLEQQKMEADLIERGNYPINPSIQPPGGFDQNQMFSFGGKPYMKAEKQNYMPTFTYDANGNPIPIIGKNLEEGFGVQFAGMGPRGPRYDADTKTDIYKRASGLRDEVMNRPEVKDFVTINTNVRSMDSLLEKAISGDQKNKVALDQGLITMYNKLTDPTSVVRESEYARTPENLPLVNRFQGAIQKIDKGGAGLTDDDRKALVWGAKVIANERGRTYNDTLSAYKNLSKEAAVPENLVLRDFKEHKDYSFGDNQKSNSSDNVRVQYNNLRQSGMSAEEAKKKLGL